MTTKGQNRTSNNFNADVQLSNTDDEKSQLVNIKQRTFTNIGGIAANMDAQAIVSKISSMSNFSASNAGTANPDQKRMPSNQFNKVQPFELSPGADDDDDDEPIKTVINETPQNSGKPAKKSNFPIN